MSHKFLYIFILALAPFLASCASTKTSPGDVIRQQDAAMELPERNVTRFENAVRQFGSLLRAYPRALTAPVLIEVSPIENISGVADGLPTDLAPILRGTLARIGRPVEVLDFDREQVYIDYEMKKIDPYHGPTMVRRQPELSVRGSITEGETRFRKGKGFQIDLLIPMGKEDEAITIHPGGSVTTIQRDEDVDTGLTKEQEIEITTLAIDLQLFDYHDMTGIDRLAESYRINVVRVDSSWAFGIFFEGSGFGIRSRIVGIQSKSRALRMASELALIHLLGRYFRVPWWRTVPGVDTDIELVRWYRDALAENSSAAGELKLLLFAYGFDADLGAPSLTQQEIDISRQLKRGLGMDPYAENDYEFIARLWESAPYDENAERRMDSIRKAWQRKVLEVRSNPPPPQPAAPTPSSDPPTKADPPGSRLRYPTVSECCPFRFPPLPPESPPPDGR